MPALDPLARRLARAALRADLAALPDVVTDQAKLCLSPELLQGVMAVVANWGGARRATRT